MKGSIQFRKDRGLYYVSWYDQASKRRYKVYKYKGEFLYSEKVAQKLLACMQNDFERKIFRIENYLDDSVSDVCKYLDEWLTTIKSFLKPGTSKDYENSVRNYLKPFFEQKKIGLAEIQYDTLLELMNFIDRSGKGRLNVMYCLHSCLDHAWRSRRIPNIPPFPRKKQYKIEKKPIVWLPEERQIAVIKSIPEIHQPIFWWLKFHFRREGEACALRNEDFDGKIFYIHRTESARVFTDTTKTGEIHNIAMVDSFKPFLEMEKEKQKKMSIISRYFFVNPVGKEEGKPYHVKTLGDIWNKACSELGEHIRCYAGTKHSSCSQFINEKGGTESELQMITDHARLESVRNYARTEVARRKELMERKVVSLQPKTIGGKA